MRLNKTCFNTKDAHNMQLREKGDRGEGAAKDGGGVLQDGLYK